MKICEWDKSNWDVFVDRSPQGLVFCKSYYLESYDQPVKYLKCSKGEEILAGFAFIESSEGIKPMPFHGYSGIIFKDLSNLKTYYRDLITFRVLESFAEYLFHQYHHVEFSNHWDIIDMRPFDWLHYQEREKGYYKINILYTSHLDISEPKNTSGYARIRKRNLNKGIKTVRFTTKESNDIELLNRLHDMNFKRQRIERTRVEIKALVNICENLIQANAGKLFVTHVNDEPAISSFFVYDRFRAYHLFVGTNLRFRDLGIGTKNLYDSCFYLNNLLGLRELDMGGVNSPKRGSYKLSYGGKIIPYYQITKVLPK